MGCIFYLEEIMIEKKQTKKIDLIQLKKIIKSGEKNKAIYCDLRQYSLDDYENYDLNRLNKISQIIRAMIFATVTNAGSGHPGGSSSKVEQFVALALGDQYVFDPTDPKNSGRDRLIWSAGHCSALLYAGQALIYEALRRSGRQFSEAVLNCIFPEHLAQYRQVGGLSAHIESIYPYSDYCTGPSGHGFSAAVGVATSHRSLNLPTKIWVMMGDAESEEGITYEARNVARAVGLENLIVSLDYNRYGIDGPINEVLNEDYKNYWYALGWNVIEVDGHNINQLLYAYRLASEIIKNLRPTVVISHTKKGLGYGNLEDTANSHGTICDRASYISMLKKMGFVLTGKNKNIQSDLMVILNTLTKDDCLYLEKILADGSTKIATENYLVEKINHTCGQKKLINPGDIKRPNKLPKEMIYKTGEQVVMRQAVSDWFVWLMKQTPFFYAGAGDLSKSVLTASAEKVYGLITADKPNGRGLRFGIAETNMAMMSMALTQDILPGGFKPVSVFGTYGVFTPLYTHPMHLALINNKVNKKTAGFFIALATHDGPETGEDGPTHHGLFWSSAFTAYPGIKLYKPADANEAVEILFYALNKGEPIILALPRPATKIFTRSSGTNSPIQSVNGAYVYKNYSHNGKPRTVAVVSGAIILDNLLSVLPKIENKLDLKIVYVSSPQAYKQLALEKPVLASQIISDEEKRRVVTLHNGWRGFLSDFHLSKNALKSSFGVDDFLTSGRADDLYSLAGLDSSAIAQKIISLFDFHEKQ